MPFDTFTPNSMKSFSLAVSFCLLYVLSLFDEIHGLKCANCNPCPKDPDEMSNAHMTTEECKEEDYANLPDKGYFGCSFEMAPNNERRKRCVWLRFDPDELMPPPAPRPQRCHLSPLDDKNYDCYCFTDECNRSGLKPPPPEKGEPEEGGPLEGHKNQGNRNQKVDIAAALCSALGIILMLFVNRQGHL